MKILYIGTKEIFNKMTNIKFISTVPRLAKVVSPNPAIKNLPDWYKKMSNFTDGKENIKDGAVNHTVKKCMPVLDSLSLGYLIPLWTDVVVYKENGFTVFSPSNHRAEIKVVDGHPQEQVPGYPFPKGYDKDVYKWINPWKIHTKRGYSCLFINPTHRNLPFKIMEGVVDTDTFPLSINFPFFLEEGFEGVIPYGTPIAQVIPFKRENYKSSVEPLDQLEYDQLHNLHDSIYKNKYKLKWWNKKSFS